MPSFVPHLQFEAIVHAGNAPKRSLAELYTFVNDTINIEERMQAYNARQYWKSIMNKGPAVKDKWKGNAGLARYLWTNQLTVEYLVDYEIVWTGVLSAVLVDLLGLLLALSHLDEL